MNSNLLYVLLVSTICSKVSSAEYVPDLKKNSDKVNQKIIFFYRAANLADNWDITHTIKLTDLFYVRNTCSVMTKLNSAASITFFEKKIDLFSHTQNLKVKKLTSQRCSFC